MSPPLEDLVMKVRQVMVLRSSSVVVVVVGVILNPKRGDKRGN